MNKPENVPSAKGAGEPPSPFRPWLVAGASVLMLAIMAGLVFLLRQTPGDPGVRPSGDTPAATALETLSANAPPRFGTAFLTRTEAPNAARPGKIGPGADVGGPKPKVSLEKLPPDSNG